jgi:methionine-S-sulfoxide reductase
VVFAGGCFWGVQGVFQHVKGVSNAVSGYIGGSAANARYERVSSGQTGHAEAVKIDYDPRQVSYGQLMQVFFSVVHDPTQLNRQGPDHGSQYRSAIFSDDARQQAASRAYIAQLGQAGSYRADRHPAGQRPALLPGRELPPELHDQLPAGGLHPLLRRTEAGRAGQAVPGAVPARCGAGADAVTAFLGYARRCSL